MRSPKIPLILALTITCVPTTAFAQEPSLRERLAVRRDLEVAKNKLRFYWQVEYPRMCRELDAAIECTRAEIDNSYSLLREYRPFTSFTIGEPFPITVRHLQMCIREAELRLNNLLDERNNLVRFHGSQFRVLASEVYEARLRVAELDVNVGDGEGAPEQLPPLQR